MEIELGKNQLRINYKAREWCLLPYPDHPRGCPNFDKRPSCPPDAPLVENFIDLMHPIFLIVVEFDLGLHILKMKRQHPEWSERQTRCVLYWQAGVNSQLENKCTLFRWSHPNTITTRCPEAMGVNVIATAQRVGIPISVKPITKIFKIALGGYPIVVPQSH